jgi:1-acyl-sn-glycerol-3-phosphate acyltransferase
MTDLLDLYAQKSEHARQAKLARFVERIFGDRAFFFLSRLLYRLQIHGEENIPSDGACIFAINHESLFTDALVYLTVRRHRPNAHVFAWGNLRDEYPMYDFMSQFGETNLEDRMLRVYKARGLSAGELLRARQELLDGGTILLAAEGDLTWDGRFQYPLEPGAVWLSLRTGAPVVPIISVGGYDVQPYWRIEKIKLTGRIKIRAGQPITFSSTPMTQVDDFILQAANQRLWDVMHTLILDTRGKPI